MPLSRPFAITRIAAAIQAPSHRRWSGLAVALLLGACAPLPRHVERPASYALATSQGTPLASLTDVLRPRDAPRRDSGFLLLAGPQDAYGARLALIDAARKTLDLQYYAIHVDASTGRLVRALRAAAARGVRVRILVDDFHSTGHDALIMRLAFEKNIELRMFNPVPGGRASMASRLFGALTDPALMQQRMHNKLFIADNVMGVTGGRNLGDAYFGNSDDGNFIDVDVLAAGPIVPAMSKSFDAYWNDERAYPAQSLISPKELDEIRAQARAEREKSSNAAEAHRIGEDAPAQPEADRQPGTAVEAQARAQRRQRVWNEEPLDLRAMHLTWAPSAVLADTPEKIGGEGEPGKAAPAAATPTPPDEDPAKLAPKDPSTETSAKVRVSGQDGAQTVEDIGVVDSLLELLRRARSSVVIVSPYFVPGQDMLDALADARRRGVRVQLLTNSLASNDAIAAHAGYVRHREALLSMGVELYELRSERGSAGGALGSSGTGSAGESRSMLHSKMLTLDGAWVVIGSMNLDLRSQLQNTELALLIHSSDLAHAVDQRLEGSVSRLAWRVRKDEHGQLIWQAPQGSGVPDAHEEPDTTLGQRMLMHLLGPLAPQRLL
ncbi:phospholipase D family protein [Variovorax sp.]|uniref:phospholipase D family protein n=1 Tax=Variovorax sp. TaxID=1871043 RepID=UPI002D436A23|nr:phospholipase D family protein [Variovorax sp.]HYP81737.1 phospholipase D family protein [Variovorax sp.]